MSIGEYRVKQAQAVWNSYGPGQVVHTPLVGHGPQAATAAFDWDRFEHEPKCQVCLKPVVPFEKISIRACVCQLKAQIAKAQALIAKIDAVLVQDAIAELLSICGGTPCD